MVCLNLPEFALLYKTTLLNSLFNGYAYFQNYLNIIQIWYVCIIQVLTFQPHVRHEVCVGLYRLCLGKTAEGKTGYPFLLPILSSLLSFMSDAFKIKPQKNLDVSISYVVEEISIS